MPLPPVAESGFAAAAAYDANRPDYPAEAVSELLRVLDVQDAARARIVDLAAGTGKFTQILAAQPENFDITAVEPHPGMREQLVSKNLRNVKVLDGSAGDMGAIEDSSVAALVAAQSFHWFSNMEALKEIHRVLQPTGVFGMIWNVEDYNAPKGWEIHNGWESVMRDEMWKLDDGLPRFRDEQWKKVFDEQSSGNPFSLHLSDPLFGLPIGESSMNTEQWLSKQAIWDRFRTYSQVANLGAEKLDDLEKIYWSAIDSPDTEVDSHGRVAVHCKVFWAWTSRIPGEPLQSGGRPTE